MTNEVWIGEIICDTKDFFGLATRSGRAMAMRLNDSCRWWLVGLVLICGCANPFASKKQAALTSPSVVIRQSSYAGSPLSGPTTAVVKPEVGTPVLADIRILATRESLGNLGNPIGAGARLISANRGGSTLQPTLSLVGGARFALDADAASSFEKLNDASGVRSSVIAQSTGRAVLAGATSMSEVLLPGDRTLLVEIYRAAGGVTASVALTGIEPQKDRSIPLRETASLDPLDLAKPRQLLLGLSSQMENSEVKGLAILVEFKPPQSDEQFAASVKQSQDQLAKSAELAKSFPTTAAVGSATATGYQSSLDALNDATRRRAALIYLSGETHASLCEDLSLVAQDTLIEKLAAKIKETLPKDAVQQRDLLGWALDRATLLLLAELSSDTKVKLAPELMAVLTRHTGEAGRHDSSLAPVVKNLQSRADLDNRLIAENLIYLEDNSPAARVRAYDFLQSKGKAPAGFDPLGSPRERRAALEKALTK